VFLFASAASAQKEPIKPIAADISSFSWFSGCWETSVPEKHMTVMEMWSKPAGGTLIGVSRTVTKDKTTAFEYIRIVHGADGIEYIVKPSPNSGETAFRLKAINEKEVIFENLNNDFPQRIIYRRGSPDALFARIEATSEGKTRGIDFPMLRIKCE